MTADTLVERISYIAKREGVTIFALERMIGASKGTLYKAIQGGKDIQAKWLTSIAETYPQYSARWILTGRLPMLEGTSPSPIHAEIKGTQNVVGHGVSVSIPSKEPPATPMSSSVLEKLLLSREEQIRELTLAIKEAQVTIRTLLDRE